MSIFLFALHEGSSPLVVSLAKSPNGRELSGTPESPGAESCSLTFGARRVGRSRGTRCPLQRVVRRRAATPVFKRVGNNSRSLIGAHPNSTSKTLLDARRLPFGRRRAARRLTLAFSCGARSASKLKERNYLRSTLSRRQLQGFVGPLPGMNLPVPFGCRRVTTDRRERARSGVQVLSQFPR